MVDTRDLKSLGLIVRAGSSPAVGTRFQLSFPFNHIISMAIVPKKELIRVKSGLGSGLMSREKRLG